MVEFGETFVDKLRIGLELALAVQKTLLDPCVDRRLPDAQPPLRNDQQVVVAHVVGAHPEIVPLVQIDVGVLRITAVKDNHYDIPDLLADQCDEFVQVALLAFGQKRNIALHIHKISDIFPEIHGSIGFDSKIFRIFA